MDTKDPFKYHVGGGEYESEPTIYVVCFLIHLLLS